MGCKIQATKFLEKLMKGESKVSQNNIKIRVSVGKFYDDISKNKKKTRVDSKALSMSLGYDEDIINEFPDEINMGLSCGNPINHLKIREGHLNRFRLWCRYGYFRYKNEKS